MPMLVLAGVRCVSAWLLESVTLWLQGTVMSQQATKNWLVAFLLTLIFVLPFLYFSFHTSAFSMDTHVHGVGTVAILHYEYFLIVLAVPTDRPEWVVSISQYLSSSFLYSGMCDVISCKALVLQPQCAGNFFVDNGSVCWKDWLLKSIDTGIHSHL